MKSSKEQDPNSSPQSFQFNFARPWTVIRPRMYRYMDKSFVEQFMKDGSLRLSSFKKFSKHADERMRDVNEGKGIRIGRSSNSTTFLVSSRGHDCYVLCGGTHNIKAFYSRCFDERHSCLAIDDTLSFANAISSHIPGFNGGFEGHVIYQDDLTIWKNMSDITTEQLMLPYKQEDGTFNMQMIPDLMDKIGGIEECFIKHSEYSIEQEYRILWASTNSIEETIDIKVPEARQYCREISTDRST